MEMTQKEFEYFIDLYDNDPNASYSHNLMIQYLYAKFNKIFSSDDITTAKIIYLNNYNLGRK